MSLISAIGILENAILRVVTSTSLSNISQNRQQLIAEHEKLADYYSDNCNYAIHRQDEPTPNLKLQSKISITDLQADNILIGKFLLCRTITRCINISSVLTVVVVEDPEGNVGRLALYNWTQKLSDEKDQSEPSVKTLLPIGTQIVIKNPSYKTAGGGNSIIFSLHYQNVIIIDNNNNLFGDLKWSTDLPVCREREEEIIKQSADDSRCRGNTYFASGDFKSAVIEYSSGIKLEPHNVTLLANRAEAYLRLCQFGRALDDVEIALKHEPGHFKLAYRKGKALCGLKRYQEAIIVLQDLYSMDGITVSIKQSTEQLLKHAKMFASENRNGQYDYVSIVNEFYEKAKLKENDKGDEDWVYKEGPRLDHAEFLIDDIEIRFVEGKGRGWFAKRDIPDKTLLMASKAFKAVFNNEIPECHTRAFIQMFNYSSRCLEELMICSAQRLIEDPDLYQEFSQLYGGPHSKKLSEYEPYLLDVPNIIKYNSFTLQSVTDAFQDLGENSQLKRYVGVGLWILPSYFNHSCVDHNVSRLFFGDLIFLRTNRNILKDEELTVGYIDVSSSYERRSSYLRMIDIDCQCRLCKLDLSETQETKLKRSQLLETFELIKPKVLKDFSLLKSLEKTVTELRSLRKEHPELDFSSFESIQYLANVYQLKGDVDRSLSITREAYNNLAEEANWHSLFKHFVFDLSTNYKKLKKNKEARRWFDLALKAFAEPIRGKFRSDETNWRKEALYFVEKVSPGTIWLAKKAELI